MHQLVLTVTIINEEFYLDSGLVPVTGQFPAIEMTLTEQPPPDEPYVLHLIAVPVRQVWFSVDTPFHSYDSMLVSDGDLLSNGGEIVCTNACLTRNLGIPSPVPDIGLDALYPAEVDTPMWWEQWFSAEEDVRSDTLGWLYHGDFLSEGGFVVTRNRDLLLMFDPLEPKDAGLDAITWNWWCHGWFFSVKTDFYSQALGEWVSHGDLLCAEHGMPCVTNADLLRNFQPVGELPNLGLDAIHMWPTGELWFSTEEGFQDTVYDWISNGDLLSDAGWVVHRNLELVSRFAPIEDLDNFGLDAVHIVPFPDGDLNYDGCVDQADLGILLADWGCAGGFCPGDCDLDGDTDQADLGILLANWGVGCS